jgi:hypothetical protein
MVQCRSSPPPPSLLPSAATIPNPLYYPRSSSPPPHDVPSSIATPAHPARVAARRRLRVNASTGSTPSAYLCQCRPCPPPHLSSSDRCCRQVATAAAQPRIQVNTATGSGIYNMVPDLPVAGGSSPLIDLIQSLSAGRTTLISSSRHLHWSPMPPRTRRRPPQGMYLNFLVPHRGHPPLWIKPPPTSLIWSFTLMLSLISLYFYTGGD